MTRRRALGRAAAGSPLTLLGGLLGLYLLAPLVAFIVRLRHGAPSTPGLGGALATSIVTASMTTAIIVLLGTPLSYALARASRPGGRGPLRFATRVLGTLVALPLALPPLMSGLLLIYLVGPYSLAGEAFQRHLTETRIGIVLAQTFVAAPFMIVAARAAFAGVDPALEDVAATLGHGRVSRFLRVAVPAALPGIGAGVLLAWLRSFGEFGATVILAYHPYTLPVFAFVEFSATGLPATVLPVGTALGLALLVLILVQLPLPRRRTGSRAVRGLEAIPPRALLAHPAEGPLDLALEKQLGSFSLRIVHAAEQRRLALLGPSGAGKTLTLRLVAGLTRPLPGSHLLSGRRNLAELPAPDRGIGYVPQQAALIPRRTVWGQVTFGVGARAGLALWWLRRLGLEGLEDRYPEELSGGQQRRVALARALAVEPRLLLLDEPFTGLDAPVRDTLRRDLRRLQRQTGMSTLLVTHDPEEAALLADEIIVIGEGRLLQAGPRREVFAAPVSPTVAALLGIANTRRGRLGESGLIEPEGASGIALSAALPAGLAGLPAGTPVVWSVRPEQIRLDPDGPYAGTLEDDADLGSVRELTVSLGPELELTLRAVDPPAPELGEPVRLAIDPERISVWAERAAGEARADRPPPTPSREPDRGS